LAMASMRCYGRQKTQNAGKHRSLEKDADKYPAMRS